MLKRNQYGKSAFLHEPPHSAGKGLKRVKLEKGEIPRLKHIILASFRVRRQLQLLSIGFMSASASPLLNSPFRSVIVNQRHSRTLLVQPYPRNQFFESLQILRVFNREFPDGVRFPRFPSTLNPKQNRSLPHARTSFRLQKAAISIKPHQNAIAAMSSIVRYRIAPFRNFVGTINTLENLNCLNR